MLYLKQSTAANVKIGPFVDATDGVTVEDGLTVSQGDVLLSKNGTALTQKNEATACTHDAIGYYLCPLDATDTGTLGRLQLAVSEAGACPVYHEYMVVTANVYDTLCSTDVLNVEITAAGVDSVWDEDVTAHTTANTAGENLNVINDMLTGKMAIVGTTRTHYKQDGVTARKTFTLDSGTQATSRTPT